MVLIGSNAMKKKTVLVTGATGFVGSHVLDALMARKDIETVAACRDPSRLLSGFSGEVRRGDLTDADYVAGVVKGVNVICHAAAWTSLWAHRNQEEHYFRDPTTALIDAAISAGVERFIFDSSIVAAPPRRDGAPIDDHEPGVRPGFWPHMDMVVDIERHMHKHSTLGMKMIVLRAGHFVGARFNLGLASLLIPRLKTHLVPWVSGGSARQSLVAGEDVASAYELAVGADGLKNYEQFNICGPSFPTLREIIGFLHDEAGTPRPYFSVPLAGAYAFGWLMEKLNPVLPGDPFLTRAIVLLMEDRHAPSDLARSRLGYVPKVDWKTAMRRQLQDEARRGHPRAALVGGRRHVQMANTKVKRVDD